MCPTYLSNVGLASTTIVTETSKFTIDNRPGISVAIGSYGWIYVLYNYDDVNRLSDLLKARLHSPVDKVTILKKRQVLISRKAWCIYVERTVPYRL